MPTFIAPDLPTEEPRLSYIHSPKRYACWKPTVWRPIAPELRISYERDGQARDLVLPIDGPSTGAADLKGDAAPPPAHPPSRWQTTVIEGDATAPPSDEPQGE